jgi:glycosyltransferase involved in cell wall biosynthesis
MSPAVFRTAHRAGAATVATTHGYRYSCPLGTLRRDGHPCHECVGHRLKVAAVRHRCYKDRLAASLAVASGLSLHHLIGTFSGCVDRFVALTPFLRDVLVDDGIPAARIAVKPNFVADPGPPRAERGGYVLFAGRLTEEKGVRTLVDGWGRYAGPLRLKVAGDGPLRSLVDELAGRDPRVDAPGWQPAEAMVDLLGDAEALVFPSEWYEAMPLTVLQALAAGTPVVVSDLPNVGDLVEEDRTGTRFATGDPGALAAALVRVERGEAVPWRSRARARFESTYREGPVMDALERIYGEAVQARRGGAVPVEVGG